MRPFSFNIRGRLVHFDRPVVMGIVNVTPDSFYGGSRVTGSDMIEKRVREMLTDGADILDVGAYSTRPGCSEVSVDEELRRLEDAMRVVRRIDGEIPVSVDTFRPEVARVAVKDMGCDIVNDVSGLNYADSQEMIDTVAWLQAPYVLMHNHRVEVMNVSERGVVREVVLELKRGIDRLRDAGVKDIIVDPGIGFSKTLEENYVILSELECLEILKCPVMIGISRKSLIYRKFSIHPEEALSATCALNSMCLDRGASILRVHDVKEARQCVEMYTMLKPRNQINIQTAICDA